MMLSENRKASVSNLYDIVRKLTTFYRIVAIFTRILESPTDERHTLVSTRDETSLT